MALEYGCLETELLDFLLDHHTQVRAGHTPSCRLLGDPQISRLLKGETLHPPLILHFRLDRKYVTTYKDKKASQWIGEIRSAKYTSTRS